MPKHLDIHRDIRKASTPRGALYGDPERYQRQLDKVWISAWFYIGGAPGEAPGSVRPLTLAEGSLDEPLVVVRDDEGELRVLSNVCTHRANLVVAEPGVVKQLRCRYHGRCFHLDGTVRSMPEFEGVDDFPSITDELAETLLWRYGPALFTALEPDAEVATVFEEAERWLGFIDPERLEPRPDLGRDYEVAAHWALYVDNYLEGFHVPWVHPGLSDALDYGSYRTELLESGVLQIGYAKDGDDDPVFELPRGHVDARAGRRVAAYYLWVYPNLMFNFYPWGLSLNCVEPLGPTRTRVRFRSFVSDPSKLDAGAGAELHRVELEDEAIVEQVQRGVRGRLYKRGRYSPTREQGVHHFHRLLQEDLG